jgi:hypothetical protein
MFRNLLVALVCRIELTHRAFLRGRGRGEARCVAVRPQLISADGNKMSAIPVG